MELLSCEFPAISRCISEMIQTPTLLQNVNMKWFIELCHFQWPWMATNPGCKITVPF